MMKKMLCLASGVLIGVGATYFYKSNKNNIDQKVRCLKRKLTKAEREITKKLNSFNSSDIEKYKQEFKTKCQEINDKIDNLTIKDIKDSTQNAINVIKEHIQTLTNKISSLTSSSSN